jgi:hypothetical protein
MTYQSAIVAFVLGFVLTWFACDVYLAVMR